MSLKAYIYSDTFTTTDHNYFNKVVLIIVPLLLEVIFFQTTTDINIMEFHLAISASHHGVMVNVLDSESNNVSLYLSAIFFLEEESWSVILINSDHETQSKRTAPVCFSNARGMFYFHFISESMCILSSESEM